MINYISNKNHSLNRISIRSQWCFSYSITIKTSCLKSYIKILLMQCRLMWSWRTKSSSEEAYIIGDPPARCTPLCFLYMNYWPSPLNRILLYVDLFIYASEMVSSSDTSSSIHKKKSILLKRSENQDVQSEYWKTTNRWIGSQFR